MGACKEKTIDESSGLAWSRSRSDVWFTHNDSGGGAEIFAFQLDGTYLETHEVTGAGLWDWEDMSYGACPAVSRADKTPVGDHCIYIGDIGDNGLRRTEIAVYVIEEPASGAAAPVVASWTAIFPDVTARNAETLMVHPCTGRIYLVTKGEVTEVWKFPEDHDKGDGSVGILEFVATLDFKSWAEKDLFTTGGDWEPHGDRVMIRTYGAGWEWVTDPADPDAHWAGVPYRVNLPAIGQGEAITYDVNSDLIVSTEKTPMRLGKLACLKASGDGVCPVDTGGDGGSADTGTTGDSGGDGGVDTGDGGAPDGGSSDSGAADGGADGGGLGDGGSGGLGEIPVVERRCGCTAGPSAWLLMPALLALGRRRRRWRQ